MTYPTDVLAETYVTFASDLEICYEVLLYLSSRLSRLKAGDTLKFITSDPTAPEKIPAWCEARAYDLLESGALTDGRTYFVIRKP
jgi:TusA-related sulfurtransferase